MSRLPCFSDHLSFLLSFIAMAILTVTATGVGWADHNDVSLQYARGFEILRHADGILVTVRPAGDKSGGAVRYLLVPRGKKITPSDPGLRLITVPVRRVVSLSTTHLAYIDAAGCTDRFNM